MNVIILTTAIGFPVCFWTGYLVRDKNLIRKTTGDENL